MSHNVGHACFACTYRHTFHFFFNTVNGGTAVSQSPSSTKTPKHQDRIVHLHPQHTHGFGVTNHPDIPLAITITSAHTRASRHPFRSPRGHSIFLELDFFYGEVSLLPRAYRRPRWTRSCALPKSPNRQRTDRAVRTPSGQIISCVRKKIAGAHCQAHK